jgi:Class III cytochrome C family
MLVLVSLTLVYPQAMISPGPLLQGHIEFADGCFACHSAWRGADSKRCIGCHALASIGLRTTKGATLPRRNMQTSFHQELIERDCMVCHSDHLGSKPAQRSRKQFSHSLLQAAVRRRCAVCHEAPSDDFHRQIDGSCQQCHSAEHWTPAKFDHDKDFVLNRDHNVGCRVCHTGDGYGQYTCYGCHEHSRSDMQAKHLEEGIRDIENCIACHRSATEEPRSEE